MGLSAAVTGGRRYSEDLPEGGLEVPCTLTLRGSHGDVDKVKVLLKVDQLIDRAACKSRWPRPLLIACENLRIGFYFAGLIFVVCQSTAKTAKIGPLENFPLYGILVLCIMYTGISYWGDFSA